MNLLLNMKDINKILAKTHFKWKFKKKMWKKNIFLRKHVSMTLLEVSLMVSEREVKSPCFLQVWWALVYMLGEFHKNRNNSTVFEELSVSIVDLTVANIRFTGFASHRQKNCIYDHQIHNWHLQLFKYSSYSLICTQYKKG